MNTFYTTTENSRWMIVDDDQQILALLSAMINKITGADVECHDSPESALAAFAATPGKYELIITDFEMPGMDGVEFCRRVHDIAPGQEVFLATGSGAFTEEAAGYAGFGALLNKPFPMSALHAALNGAGLETHPMSLAA